MTAWKKEAIQNNETCYKKKICSVFYLQHFHIIIIQLSLYDCKKCIFIHSLKPFHMTEEVLGVSLLIWVIFLFYFRSYLLLSKN